MTKQISKTVFAVIILAVFGLAASPSLAQAVTSQELLAKIAQLQTQIVALQQQLAVLQDGTSVWCYDFNTNLKIGDSGKDVEALEYILIKEGFSVTEHGSNFPAVYDEKMASAVTGFQQKYTSEILTPLGLKYGTGYVGKSTRAKLNSLYGCNVYPVTRPVYSVEPAGVLTRGQTYTFTSKIANGTPNSLISFYLQRPDGTMEYNGVSSWPIDLMCITLVGVKCWAETDANGNFTRSLTETIPDSAQTGAWISWVTVSGIVSNKLYHSVVATTTPSITVISPNGGERWVIGNTYEIKWTATGVEKVIIYLYDYAGAVGTRALVYDVLASNGKYSWTISSEITLSSMLKIAVRDSLAQQKTYDLSDNYFSIVAPSTTPSITVLSPNGGEQWQIGNTYEIKVQVDDSINLQSSKFYLKDSRQTAPWLLSTPQFVCSTQPGSNVSTCFGNWSIPDIQPGNGVFKLRIETADATVNDESDGYFSIVSSAVASCNTLGTMMYTASDGTGFIGCDIKVSGDFVLGKSYCQGQITGRKEYLKPDSYGRANQYYATLTGLKTTEEVKVFIASTDGREIECLPSLNKQTATPSLTVLSPNGGEQWTTGASHAISWQSANVPAGATAGLALYKGGVYKPEYFRVYQLPPTTGTYNWAVPNTIPAGNDYKMEVEMYNSSGNLVVLDQSDGYFNIVASSASGAANMLNIGNQLASISEAVSGLLKSVQEFVSAR